MDQFQATTAHSKRQSPLWLSLFAVGLLSACQAGSDTTPEETRALPSGLNLCPDERPDVCTQQYDPVCGYFQPGITEQGRSSSREWATEQDPSGQRNRGFGNACSACAQADVVGYLPGECPEQ